MKEKDIYATMARIKLAAIMAEEDNTDHGDCYCTACIAKKVANHPSNCRCNGCFMVREELGLWGNPTTGAADKG